MMSGMRGGKKGVAGSFIPGEEGELGTTLDHRCSRVEKRALQAVVPQTTLMKAGVDGLWVCLLGAHMWIA